MGCGEGVALGETGVGGGNEVGGGDVGVGGRGVKVGKAVAGGGGVNVGCGRAGAVGEGGWGAVVPARHPTTISRKTNMAISGRLRTSPPLFVTLSRRPPYFTPIRLLGQGT